MGDPWYCRVEATFALPLSGIDALRRDQLDVTPPLDYPAGIESEDLVHGFESCQPVRDHHRGLASSHVDQVGSERVGRGGIEMFSWFVEDEHGEGRQQRAGDRQA